VTYWKHEAIRGSGDRASPMSADTEGHLLNHLPTFLRSLGRLKLPKKIIFFANFEPLQYELIDTEMLAKETEMPLNASVEYLASLNLQPEVPASRH